MIRHWPHISQHSIASSPSLLLLQLPALHIAAAPHAAAEPPDITIIAAPADSRQNTIPLPREERRTMIE